MLRFRIETTSISIFLWIFHEVIRDGIKIFRYKTIASLWNKYPNTKSKNSLIIFSFRSLKCLPFNACKCDKCMEFKNRWIRSHSINLNFGIKKNQVIINLFFKQPVKIEKWILEISLLSVKLFCKIYMSKTADYKWVDTVA